MSNTTLVPPALELRGVHKTYRLGRHVVPALQGVDLLVRPGEMLALTGPSGSGKSTLLNLAGLVDRPDAGEVLFRGRSLAGLSETQATYLRRDAIGFIFQSFNLVPAMTVADNVDYPLFLAGLAVAERNQRVAEMLRAVGLTQHSRHRPDEMSGGQRQRVAIARALTRGGYAGGAARWPQRTDCVASQCSVNSARSWWVDLASCISTPVFGLPLGARSTNAVWTSAGTPRRYGR